MQSPFYRQQPSIRISRLLKCTDAVASVAALATFFLLIYHHHWQHCALYYISRGVILRVEMNKKKRKEEKRGQKKGKGMNIKWSPPKSPVGINRPCAASSTTISFAFFSLLLLLLLSFNIERTGINGQTESKKKNPSAFHAPLFYIFF